MKKTSTLLGLVLLASTLTGCISDPCEHLPIDDRVKTVIDNGGEVERLGKRGAECEIGPAGVWEVDS